MSDWISMLSALSDEPTELEQQGGLVMFPRRGQDYLLTIRQYPAIGLAVASGDTNREEDFQPFHSFVQAELLKLPQLARQVIRVLEKNEGTRPVPYVDGPARLTNDGSTSSVESAMVSMKQFLDEAVPGSTRLVQLMATAGQGKTVLLETVALHRARQYTPEPFPASILVPVDLLGRYVGTIDDAIAGTLNNTYNFPALTQREVALCIRNRWMSLALDGFDELVARVGVRDAFLRINELLDQLDGQGTIVISARQSFFQLYNVSAAIRSYLQPHRGSYSTAIMELEPWGQAQGVEVFAHLGSHEPSEDFAEFSEVFGPGDDVVLHPFLLTRLAKLWIGGERFGEADKYEDSLSRTDYMVWRFIDRESGEKWTDREHSRPLLETDEHATVLGAVAEEMWRTEAFALDKEELRLAAEIGLSRLTLNPELREQVLERVPTHAVLVGRNRGYSFLHERFFAYFFGHRLAELIRAHDQGALEALFSRRVLAPDLVDWTRWSLRKAGHDVRGSVEFLNGMIGKGDTTTVHNLSAILAHVLDGEAQEVALKGLQVTGDAFAGLNISNISLESSAFWVADWTGLKLTNSTVTDCHFADVLVDTDTELSNTEFVDCAWKSLEFVGQGRHFAPEAIANALATLGATVRFPESTLASEKPKPRASQEAIDVVEALVKQSQLTCDFALEQMEEKHGPLVREIVRAGLKADLLKTVNKAVSGPKRQFVRFNVDRDLLLEGQVVETSDPAIEDFWSLLHEQYPFETE